MFNYHTKRLFVQSLRKRSYYWHATVALKWKTQSAPLLARSEQINNKNFKSDITGYKIMNKILKNKHVNMSVCVF